MQQKVQRFNLKTCLEYQRMVSESRTDRLRKIGKNETDQEAIERQLTNDFEVHEYLQRKQESHNVSEYAKMLNSLIVSSNHKKMQVERIKASHSQGEGEWQAQQQQEERLSFLDERTSQEMEISKNLQHQIVEIKKSLTLMKGDIGHLVGREESTKLLSSKVAKVKIVAEDQLKRVSLALAKDREEIKIRNEMQKKFNKKLKNVSSYEHSSLARMKKQYAQNVLRKQDIFQRLLFTQAMTGNLVKMGNLKVAEKEKEAFNREQLQLLLKLRKSVMDFEVDADSLPGIGTHFRQYFQQLEDFDLEGRGELNATVENILGRYEQIKSMVKMQSAAYNEMLQKKEEMEQKYEDLLKQEDELLDRFQLEQLEAYRVSPEVRKEYEQRLKQLAKSFKNLYTILSYFQKDLPPQLDRTMAGEGSLSILLQDSNNQNCHSYITCLHKIHSLLATPTPSPIQTALLDSSPEQFQQFYDSMVKSIQEWLKAMKYKYSEERISSILNASRAKQRHSMVQKLDPRMSHLKKDSQLIDSETLRDGEQEMEFIPSNPPLCLNSRVAGSIVKLTTEESGVPVQAKRIKLLQNIDKDYYKMIKSTIKMEKENTRKNYNFQRNFKRTKYASRDNILQEKRFEASFSVLVTNKPSPTNRSDIKSQTASDFLQQKTVTRSSFFASQHNNNLSSTATPKSGWLKRAQTHCKARSRFADKLQLALSYA